VAPGTFTSVEAPAVTGVAKVGWWLEASPGSWSPSPHAVSYQWLRDGVPVTRATAKTYHLKGPDLGARVSVRVTVSATAYDEASATSQATATVTPAPPSLGDAE
ncbi:MAG: putative surface-anchored protein, partial [Sphaerisporangium sp.]|nr:putative surface-anchored protein [Sphaerisporangium sp.]